MQVIKHIGLFILDKWFDIIISGGSIIETYRRIIKGVPDMNTLYIWLICWSVGLITYVLLGFRRNLRQLLPTGKIIIKDIYGQSYKNETVQLDNKNFFQCSFENVTFRWDGEYYRMTECSFNGESRFETHNTSFVNLTDLYKHLGFLNEEFAKSWKYFNVNDKK